MYSMTTGSMTTGSMTTGTAVLERTSILNSCEGCVIVLAFDRCREIQ
jgi:hypothetical protein